MSSDLERAFVPNDYIVKESLHVMPINDLREHISSKDCWCKPTPDEDEPMVMIHHSLDQREQYEETGRKAS